MRPLPTPPPRTPLAHADPFVPRPHAARRTGRRARPGRLDRLAGGLRSRPRRDTRHEPLRRRLQALHRVLHPGRDRAPHRRRGGQRRAPARPRQYRGRPFGAQGRRDRRLSGIPRHHRCRDPRPSDAEPAREPRARARRPGAGPGRALRLLERLRARDAGGARAAPARRAPERPRRAPGSRPRPLARVPRPPGRLARSRPALRAAAAARGHRPRPVVRRAGQRPHRGNGRLHDRRADRRAPPARARRRPRLLPALRRRAAVPAGRRRAPSGGLARDPAPARTHPGGDDDRDECARRARARRLRRDRARLRHRPAIASPDPSGERRGRRCSSA